MARKKRSLKLEQAAVDQWNALFTIGTAVYVKRDDGEQMESRTTSEAWLLCSQVGVIKVEGISGCYHLERVRLRTEPICEPVIVPASTTDEIKRG